MRRSGAHCPDEASDYHENADLAGENHRYVMHIARGDTEGLFDRLGIQLSSTDYDIATAFHGRRRADLPAHRAGPRHWLYANSSRSSGGARGCTKTLRVQLHPGCSPGRYSATRRTWTAQGLYGQHQPLETLTWFVIQEPKRTTQLLRHPKLRLATTRLKCLKAAYSSRETTIQIKPYAR